MSRSSRAIVQRNSPKWYTHSFLFNAYQEYCIFINS